MLVTIVEKMRHWSIWADLLKERMEQIRRNTYAVRRVLQMYMPLRPHGLHAMIVLAFCSQYSNMYSISPYQVQYRISVKFFFVTLHLLKNKRLYRCAIMKRTNNHLHGFCYVLTVLLLYAKQKILIYNYLYNCYFRVRPLIEQYISPK
jgi:hypothetical protein